MRHSDEITPGSVRIRLHSEQQLWLLRGEDGTYLAAGQSRAEWLLSWTTRDEMDTSVRHLEERAPELIRAHAPIQRTVREAIETAQRLGCRLRIDEYVVEGLCVNSPREGDNG